MIRSQQGNSLYWIFILLVLIAGLAIWYLLPDEGDMEQIADILDQSRPETTQQPADTDITSRQEAAEETDERQAEEPGTADYEVSPGEIPESVLNQTWLLDHEISGLQIRQIRFLDTGIAIFTDKRGRQYAGEFQGDENTINILTSTDDGEPVFIGGNYILTDKKLVITGREDTYVLKADENQPPTDRQKRQPSKQVQKPDPASRDTTADTADKPPVTTAARPSYEARTGEIDTSEQPPRPGASAVDHIDGIRTIYVQYSGKLDCGESIREALEDEDFSIVTNTEYANAVLMVEIENIHRVPTDREDIDASGWRFYHRSRLIGRNDTILFNYENYTSEDDEQDACEETSENIAEEIADSQD